MKTAGLPEEPHWLSVEVLQSRDVARWVRLSLSVGRLFVCRCLNSSTRLITVDPQDLTIPSSWWPEFLNVIMPIS
jgi:hypothetical protein